MLLWDTIEFAHMALGLVPEILDAVYVVVPVCKELGVIDPEVVKIRHIQHVIASPAVRINDTVRDDRLKKQIGSLVQTFASKNPAINWSDLVAKVNIALGILSVELDATAIAKHLELPLERLMVDALTISTAFQLRRKGVETKIVLGNAPPEVDLT